MKPARLGAWLVAVLFCAPLFAGLGRGDLWGDEAGHSFSVDRILETGDWLVPKSSPHEDAAFLEKPPLKFWIVAAGIRTGLLPHNEFGLRFWDALFGSLAFLYVFAIGRRLAGVVCGVVAVLTLFAFWPLVFDHGLRSNNMEAALLLCYCGGMYHFLEAFSESSAVRRHAVAVGLYFTLGFMTKFVAAIFLPVVIATTVLAVPGYRLRLAQEWKSWAIAKLVTVVLVAPWFVYATVRFGSGFWAIILGQQVLTRMSTFLDPGHVQPWDFYWVTIYRTFSYAGALALVAAGLLLLAIQTVRRRWPDGLVVLVWAAVPLVLISFGSSKLIHYMYPFVPPFALAAGYLAALIVMLAPAPLERLARRGALAKAVMAAAAAGLALLAVTTAVWGPASLEAGGHLVLRNASVFRPAAGALAALGMALGTRRSVRLAAICLVLVLLPIPAYAEDLGRLREGRDESSWLRDMRDCLQRVQAQPGHAAGIYADIAGDELQHHTYYYFRRLQPFVRDESTDIRAIQENIEAGRPVLFSQRGWNEARRAGLSSAGWPIGPRVLYGRYVIHDEDALANLIVLPGPYAACRPPGSVQR